ncbi:MAG: GNAT family N-acetyltransferase [Rhodanobacter sp.]|jgi:GNAT superfamily N-acetyltransferase|uniref:GNAT family N-acetyltransferase n=1 Tax=Rhodanobacter sp. KK11 TaxID=3083255 RepID=UPI0029670044|nr:GNAT family N-acetyltransferase [Rhodanobacter sp. KK11]MDW2982374.1 GNAT family N-acetyltransferase [Rhodanobacter sp. KK11]
MVIRYRLASPPDALAIGVLARRVTRRWILPEQPASAARPLLLGMRTRVIRGKILAGQRFHLAWQDDGRLVGVAAMREDSHLFQFFVATRMHGHGIARRLWQRTMRDAVRRAGTRHFTLNASAMAVPVYLHFGFVPSGPLTISSTGLVVQPMHLDRPS